MRYFAAKPTAALQRYVECYWFLQGDASPGLQRVLPDGCPELIFNLGDAMLRRHSNAIERQPRQLVSGQLQSFLALEPTGRVDVMGVRFHPAGALPLLRVALCELTDLVIDAHLVVPELDLHLAERLSAACETRDRVAIIEVALGALLAEQPVIDPAVATATRLLLASHGGVPIDVVARKAELGARALERRFDRWVGISPKALASILRFQAVLSVADASPQSWARTAVACGYYDQSHLIHDFKRLAGQTPPQLLEHGGFFAAALSRKRR